MHGALLRASAVRTRLPPLRSRAVRVWLRDMALRIGAAQSKFNHTSLQVTHKILSRGRGAKKFHGAYFALKFRRRLAADTERSINF